MKKIDAKQLKIGMYVSRVDKPWLETPFLFQGFLIETEKQLSQVQTLCEFVYVDEERSYKGGGSMPGGTVDPSKPTASYKPPPARPYVKSFDEEIPVAVEVHDQTMNSLKQTLNDIRLGKNIASENIKSSVRSMMESIMRNPDALVLFGNLKSKTQDTARHSINVCILSLVFGRYLGLSGEQLVDLGISALLHDVGEIRVAPEILEKQNRGLNPDEKKQLQLHTQHGVNILQHSPGIPQAAIDVAYCHHERINGKGYPRAIAGDQISSSAKLVAIVDVYETVTNSPGVVRQVPPTDALKSIYTMRNSFFDGDLVEQFIKCLGIYPIGSVVELSSGEVGIVISAKPDRHLSPTVMVVRSKDKSPCYPPHIVNLENFRSENHNPKLSVRKVMEPNAYDIDLSDYLIREVGFSGR